MVGYVVHYWQPNHPDLMFRSNVNRTLLLLQIGEHFVPVGENGVMDYNNSNAPPEVRGETVSAENLNGLTRRSRSSRSRRMSDSIRKLKSEEEPVMPVVVVPEEERSDIVKDEEVAEGGGDIDQSQGSAAVVVVVGGVTKEPSPREEDEEGEKKVEKAVEEDRSESRSLTNIEEELARVRE